jgi:competence protein ComEA
LILIGLLVIILGICGYDYFQKEEVVEEYQEPTYFEVSITGAVLRSGIYEVPSNWLLKDLLDLCGLSNEADLQTINLLTPLEANMTYLIPRIELNKTEVDYLYLNINIATAEELDKLPGIGPDLAQAIVLYRLTKYFETIEEIMEIDGIGEATYEKIKPHIFV